MRKRVFFFFGVLVLSGMLIFIPFKLIFNTSRDFFAGLIARAATTTGAPSVPEITSVTSLSACAVRLKWNQTDSVASFQLKVNSSSFTALDNSFVKNGTTALEKIFDHKFLDSNTSYGYQLKACNTVGGCSGSSGTPQQITTSIIQEPPVPPSVIRVDRWESAGGGDRVVLSWSPGVVNQYSGFRIYRSDDNGSFNAIGTYYSGDFTSKLDGSLVFSDPVSADQKHAYKIKTFQTDNYCVDDNTRNINNETRETEKWVKFSTTYSAELIVPKRPANLAVKETKDNLTKAKFGWDDIQGENHYEFQISDDNFHTLAVNDSFGANNNITDWYNFASNKTFYFRARACASSGGEACSGFSSGSFTSAYIAPKELKANILSVSLSTNKASVFLSWVDEANNTKSIRVYRNNTLIKEISGRCSGFPTICEYDTSYIDNNVSLGSVYTYQVKFYDLTNRRESDPSDSFLINLEGMIALKGWGWGNVGMKLNNVPQGVGWIRLSNNTVSEDGNESTDEIDYGVYMDKDGKLSGYAWSGIECPPGVTDRSCGYGWLSFNKSDLVGCPPGGGTCEAKVIISGNKKGEVSGWARFLTGESEWGGWLSLRGRTVPGNIPYGLCYGSVLNPDTFGATCSGNGTLSYNPMINGWAWGNNITGWVGFGNIFIVAPTFNDPVAGLTTEKNPKVTLSWSNTTSYDSIVLERRENGNSAFVPVVSYTTGSTGANIGSNISYPDIDVNLVAGTMYEYKLTYLKNGKTGSISKFVTTLPPPPPGEEFTPPSPSLSLCEPSISISKPSFNLKLGANDSVTVSATVSESCPTPTINWIIGIKDQSGNAGLGEVNPNGGSGNSLAVNYTAPSTLPNSQTSIQQYLDITINYSIPDVGSGTLNRQVPVTVRKPFVYFTGFDCQINPNDSRNFDVRIGFIDEIGAIKAHTVNLLRSDNAVGTYPRVGTNITSPYTNDGILKSRRYYYKLQVAYTAGGTEETMYRPVFCSPEAREPSNVQVFSNGPSTLYVNWRDNDPRLNHRIIVERLKVTPARPEFDKRLEADGGLGFDAKPLSPTSAEIKWKNATNWAPYYNVLERSTNAVITKRFTATDTSRVPFEIDKTSPIIPQVGATTPITSSYQDNTLQEATKYYYRVKACSVIPISDTEDGFKFRAIIKDGNVPKPTAADSNVNICGPYSVSTPTQEVAITTPLNAPTGFAVSSLSKSRIKLEWKDKSGKEDGFEVWRSTDPNPTTRVYTLLPTQVSAVVIPPTDGQGGYTDTGLSSQTTYYYKIRAYKTITDTANPPTFSPWKLYSDFASEAAVTTHFEMTINKPGNGTGSVTSNPIGVSCGGTCSAEFANGTAVTLTATPDTNMKFVGWSGGGCSGTGTCQVSGNATVTANFEVNTYTVIMTKPSNGWVISTNSIVNDDLSCGVGGRNDCSASNDPGYPLALSATPDTGYKFAGWSCSGSCSPAVYRTDCGTACASIQNNATISATFSPIYTLTLSGNTIGFDMSDVAEIKIWSNSCVLKKAAGTASGAMTATGDSCVTPNRDSGSSVRISIDNNGITPADATIAWGETGCSGNFCDITMTGNKTVTITLTKAPVAPPPVVQYSITVTSIWSTSAPSLGSITITSDLPGISNCNLSKWFSGGNPIANCTSNFDSGSRVTLSRSDLAEAQIRWSAGCLSGTGGYNATCTVNLNANKTITLTVRNSSGAFLSPSKVYASLSSVFNIMRENVRELEKFALKALIERVKEREKMLAPVKTADARKDSNNQIGQINRVSVKNKINYSYASFVEAINPWISKAKSVLGSIFKSTEAQAVLDYQAYFASRGSDNDSLLKDTNLEPNTVYIYRVKSCLGSTDCTDWSIESAGKTMFDYTSEQGIRDYLEDVGLWDEDMASSPPTLASVSPKVTKVSMPICTRNSYCDHSIEGVKIDVNISGASKIPLAESQCLVNDDCRSVGSSERKDVKER